MRTCLILVSLLPIIDLAVVYWMYVLVMTLQGKPFSLQGTPLLGSQLVYAIAVFILLTVIRQAAEYVMILKTRHFTQALFRHYSSRLLGSYLSMSWIKFTSETRAVRLKHLTATALDSAYSFQVVFHFAGSLTSLVLLTASMLVINVYLAVGGIVILLVFSLVSRRITKTKMKRLTFEHNYAQRRFYDRIQESLTMFREIRLFGVQQPMSERVRGELDKLSEMKVRMSTYPHMPRLLLELVFTVTIGLCMIPLALTGERSMPELIAGLASMTLLSRRMIPSMALLLTSYTELDGTHANLKLLFEQLDGSREEGSYLSVRPLQPHVMIELADVGFAYGGQRQIVSRLTLRIEERERIALTGETGSGKSTLLMICAGLLKPGSGVAFISESLAALPNGIAYVPQETALLSGSVADNIVFGAGRLDEPLLWRVLEQVHLAGKMRSLASGIHTEIGDNGVLLSGGERQRLGIARALYRLPRLLLLDEATSALDEQTELEVMRNLDLWMGEGSIVFITHRQMNTTRYASRTVHLSGPSHAEGDNG